MIEIDPKLQEAVWSRVMGNGGCPPSQVVEQPEMMMPAAEKSATPHCAQTMPAAQREMQTIPATMRGEQTMPDEMMAAELLEMMQDEKNDCATYRYLSCKSCGCDAKMLMQIAKDEACHFRRLHAMYFLMTGYCECLEPEKPDCTTCIMESLRMRYEAELEDAQMYTEAAKRWPAMADEFLCLAAEETAHSKKIRSIICNRL